MTTDPLSADAPTAAASPTLIMDADDVARALARIAHEIVERHKGTAGLVIVGIHTRGVPLADRLAARLEAITGEAVEHGSLDVTLYRDDIGLRPPGGTREVALPDVTGRVVVLVDDVLYTGRTVRAALDGLIDFARPCAIRLAVLVDRGHRELPIRADFVGKNVPTKPTQSVQVCLEEIDGRDAVLVSDASALSSGASQESSGAEALPAAGTRPQQPGGAVAHG